MRKSLVISVAAHVAVLILCLVTLVFSPPAATPLPQTIPVSTISATDFTKLTQGVENAPAPKADEPKPLADKVDAPKPVKELAPKVADKPDIITDVHTSAPESKSQPKPPDKAEKSKDLKIKPDQIADELKKDEPKKKAEKKPPEFKPDQIAEELKKDEAKKLRPPAKFDADQVAALLDKREPRRQVATAETLNNAATLGSPVGHAAQLSQSEMDALRRRLSECWNPPAGVDVNSNVYVVLHVLFKPDGSLASEPVVVQDSAASLGPALAESGKRALLACQPFTMLRPEHYDAWKDILVGFNPHELLGQ
jgi:outer membrane biosynthesis protein TonB